MKSPITKSAFELSDDNPTAFERFKKKIKTLPYLGVTLHALVVRIKQLYKQSPLRHALKYLQRAMQLCHAFNKLFFYFYIKGVNYSEPLYNVPLIKHHPLQHACLERADAMLQIMKTRGQGGHLLDVNCELGYFAHFFAAHGYAVDALGQQRDAIAVCEVLKKLHRYPISFAVQTPDPHYLGQIIAGQYGVALLATLLRDAVLQHGMTHAQHLAAQWLQKIPVLFFELTTTQSPTEIFALSGTITIEKISTVATGTLYQVQSQAQYLCGEYRNVYAQKFSAYEGAAYFGRHYYDCGNTFVKKYLLAPCADNAKQILHEINHYRHLPDNPFFPRLLAERQEATFIEVLFSKLPGDNLHDLLVQGKKVPPLSIFCDVVQALAFLRQQGLYHNDVRLWNMMFDGEKTYLFDLGLARRTEQDNTCLALLWLIRQLHEFVYQIHPYPLKEAPDFQQVTLSPPFDQWVTLLQHATSFEQFLLTFPQAAAPAE